MSLTHRSWVNQMVSKITPEKMANPYFVAVLDGPVTVAKLSRMMKKLPGVLSVDEESEQGQKKLEALVNQLGTEYSLSSSLMDFKSVRVILRPTLSPESLDFVREQAIKLGGKEHVTATDIKYPEVTSVMKSHPFYHFLEKAGDWGVVGILAICWIISYWLSYDIFRSRSYVIEKFQRRKLVAAKSLASGLSLILGLFIALGVWHGTLKVLDLIVLVMIFSVFWTFSMQEWRWKPTI